MRRFLFPSKFWFFELSLIFGLFFSAYFLTGSVYHLGAFVSLGFPHYGQSASTAFPFIFLHRIALGLLTLVVLVALLVVPIIWAVFTGAFLLRFLRSSH